MPNLVKIAGSVGLGLTLSQFPEYSQQYVQRLGGAVDELSVIVADFDATAAQADKTRDQALNALQGSAFLEGRQADMRRTIERQESLTTSYNTLKDASPLGRLANIRAFGDPQVIKGAWKNFAPAIPLNLDGLLLLFGGYITGYAGLAGLGRIFRRRNKKQKFT
ncbi:hypothetical protein GCM10007939_12440 [Amylibacter marinus]|uniref:DUF2937 family protein n=1 Tax=Amylibacter marinus TaxID=1475483 RepID=A0ABQ5VUM9_9RHOB|nr:DUF2937 family protein [Amylibacter marinus]GLQ34961.1 hypothetical protein GCM10007939_12440 [Amylibacter marinus]